MDLFRRFDLIRKAFVLQEQVLPGLDVRQLERNQEFTRFRWRSHVLAEVFR
jgi:hypothetical protein